MGRKEKKDILFKSFSPNNGNLYQTRAIEEIEAQFLI